MKPHSWDQVSLLDSCVPVKGLDERNVYKIIARAAKTRGGNQVRKVISVLFPEFARCPPSLFRDQ